MMEENNANGWIWRPSVCSYVFSIISMLILLGPKVETHLWQSTVIKSAAAKYY